MLPNYKSSKVAEAGATFFVEWPQLNNFKGSQSIQDDLFKAEFEDENLKDIEDFVQELEHSESSEASEEEEDLPEKKGTGLRISSEAY